MRAQNKNVLILISILTSLNYCFSQDTDDTENSLHVGFSAGQASDNAYTKSLPASFIATFPENDTISNSYSINGFLGVDFKVGDKTSPKWKFSVNTELHRNTLISKEQNTVQFGFSIQHLVPFFHRGGNKLYPTLLISPDVSFKYSNDKVKDKQGMQYLGYLSFSLPLSFENEKGEATVWNYFRPNIIYPGDERANNNDTTSKFGEYPSDWFQLKHFHSVGLENIANESLTLINTSLGIEIYPLSGLLYDIFKQYGILQFRYAITNREKLSSRNTELYVGALKTIGASLNYKFDKDGKTAISIGYEHSNGGNPLKGLDDNEFGQLKISAIVNL